MDAGPDYFDNVSITPSVNYYVQKLFGTNHGDEYLPTTVKIQVSEPKPTPTVPNGVMLGSWNTQVKFDDVKILNGAKEVLNETFDSADRWNIISGRWQVSDGVYSQGSNDMPALSRFAFDDDKSGYTVTLRAMKTGGDEGFLVVLARWTRRIIIGSTWADGTIPAIRWKSRLTAAAMSLVLLYRAKSRRTAGMILRCRFPDKRFSVILMGN